MHATSIRRTPRIVPKAPNDYGESIRDRQARENREQLVRFAKYVCWPAAIFLFLWAVSHLGRVVPV